jgi:hypothetical protein
LNGDHKITRITAMGTWLSKRPPPMSSEQLLTSLAQYLKARLDFRRQNLIDAVKGVVTTFTKAGSIHNGRIGIAVAQAYEREARSRAEMIANDLRQARASWSAKQLVDSQQELKTCVSNLFKENLSEAASLAEQMGTIRNKRQNPQLQSAVTLFLEISDRASKSALSMVVAVIDEIAAAAAHDMAVHDQAERPSYVYQNTFNAPVNAIAQGNASIGQATQTAGSLTAMELAESVAIIVRALPTPESSAPDIARATLALQSSEAELREGKLPMRRLVNCLNLLGKAEDIAVKAPDALQHIQTLLSHLGLC